ncbi:MAG: hypothetical protein HQL69_15030 [Magnetococcales bacterium]|nr:hypothetical protein [Magnetococcales bacterium]
MVRKGKENINSIQLAEDTECLLASGLDSLYVSFYLDLSTGVIDWEELSLQKIKLQTEQHEKFAKITLGYEVFAIKPFGRNPYTYVLENEYFNISLGEKIQPNCYVKFSSKGLWQLGLNALMERTADWLDSLNIVTVKPESISRADFAFDYYLPAPNFDLSNFVTRATKKSTWTEHNKLQTIQLGAGDIVIRVYDKVAEISQQSKKSWFFEIWNRTSDVWRIEFQIRGKALREVGIETLSDLKHYQNSLLKELAEQHTTLRVPSSDSNRSRWPLHPLWEQLQNDISILPQSGLGSILDPEKSVQYRMHMQAKSIYGHLKGFGVLLQAKEGGPDPPQLENVVQNLVNFLLLEHHQQTVWKADLSKKYEAWRLGQW